MNTNDTRSPAVGRHPWLALAAGAVAVNAVGGAAALAVGAIDMGATVNQRFPFHSPGFAAFALLVVVGAPMAAAGWLAATGRPLATETAMIAGVLLVAWIVVQLLVIRTFSWLQPTMALAGAAVFLTACLVRARSTPRP